MTANKYDRYSNVAIALHWLIALLVIGQLAGGIYMSKLPDTQASLKFELFQLHKSFGITILLLTLIRLGWRLTHKAPPLPAEMPRWEKISARGAHVGFYILLIALPLVGWAVVSSSPLADSVQTYLFGVIHWPHLPFFEGVADRKALSHEIAEIHEKLAFVMIGLIVLHVGAALKHKFVNRDRVLANMLPLVRKRA
jgi:cytochrome b561